MCAFCTNMDFDILDAILLYWILWYKSFDSSQILSSIVQVFELREDGKIKFTILGTDMEAGQRPQYTVPPNVWFGSFPTRDLEAYSSDGSSLVKAPPRDPQTHYSLVGCTCAPAFQFEDFELASSCKILAFAPHAEPFIRYLTLPKWSYHLMSCLFRFSWCISCIAMAYETKFWVSPGPWIKFIMLPLWGWNDVEDDK